MKYLALALGLFALSAVSFAEEELSETGQAVVAKIRALKEEEKQLLATITDEEQKDLVEAIIDKEEEEEDNKAIAEIEKEEKEEKDVEKPRKTTKRRKTNVRSVLFVEEEEEVHEGEGEEDSLLTVVEPMPLVIVPISAAPDATTESRRSALCRSDED
ncbi:hypothetical protein V3C99_012529, partial [Haemonchus contortus]